MIEVLFFARIREQLDVDKVGVDFSSEIPDVAALIKYLIKNNDDRWAVALGAENVVKAVNQEVVADSYRLTDGDEVAFFPPVTGG